MIPLLVARIVVEVVDKVATITWSKGLDEAVFTGANSIFFVGSPNVEIMDIDNGDKIFSTNNDMIVSSLSLESGSNTSNIELGYGPTNDSTVGWTKLWTVTVPSGGIINIPRKFFLPKGNFLTVNKVGGTGNLHFTGTISIQQTVPLDSDLNDDMEGNSP